MTVQPGQQIRVGGQWHTVRGVRAEQCMSDGIVMVLELDTGPGQRVAAAEPLTVRDRGPHG